MGALTRVREGISQKTMSRNKEFVPTVSERTQRTYEEAKVFATNLKTCSKEIRALQVATAGMLAATSKTLSTPLPRVYDVDGTTKKALPSFERETERERMTMAEEEVNVRDLEAISYSTTTRMERDVLRPMEQWLKVYKTFPAKLKRIEKQRLDYDASRRAYNVIADKVYRRSLGGSESAKLNAEMSARKAAKDAKEIAYVTYEDECHRELTQLVKDAKSLRTYLVAAMRVQEQAFSSATVGETPALNMAEMLPAVGSQGQQQHVPTPISEDVSRAHHASTSDGLIEPTVIRPVTNLSPLTSQEPVELARANEGAGQVNTYEGAGQVNTYINESYGQETPVAGSQFHHSPEVMNSHSNLVPNTASTVSTPRSQAIATPPRRMELDIPPALSMEDELPSVPRTHENQKTAEQPASERRGGFMNRLLGVGA